MHIEVSFPRCYRLAPGIIDAKRAIVPISNRTKAQRWPYPTDLKICCSARFAKVQFVKRMQGRGRDQTVPRGRSITEFDKMEPPETVAEAFDSDVAEAPQEALGLMCRTPQTSSLTERLTLWREMAALRSVQSRSAQQICGSHLSASDAPNDSQRVNSREPV